MERWGLLEQHCSIYFSTLLHEGNLLGGGRQQRAVVGLGNGRDHCPGELYTF